MAKKNVTERLKIIQRRLGVDDDGMLGPQTLSGIEMFLDKHAPQTTEVPVHSLVASLKGLNMISQFEISSDGYYKRRLSRPTLPGAHSGITIGVGYDLGFNSKRQIRKDWQGKIPDAHLEELVNMAGLTKRKAAAVLQSVRHIKIPLEAAKEVFFLGTLPRYAKKTRDVYPGVEELPADAQAMLLSLIFNRGGSMSSKSSRREMRDIRPLVAAKDLKGIAQQIRSMKRLWDKKTLRGLHIRRDKEADGVENARTVYEPSQLIRV